MDNYDKKALDEHYRGAIVKHANPFEELVPIRNDIELTAAFVNEWVAPFYIQLKRTDPEWIEQLSNIKSGITKEVIANNLGDINWRSRQTGAYFAAITNRTEFIDAIGIHLLKSEVCYAGAMYCTVLAYFNTPKCVEYLNRYLYHYLKIPDLWFDQREALQAIAYTDKVNYTNHFAAHVGNWHEFIKNKPHWDKDISTDMLEKQIETIESVRNNTI